MLEYLKKENEDFEKNKEKYFEKIKEICKKYEAEAYLFGSYLKGEALAGSDVDVLIVIPKKFNRIEVLLELRKNIRNRKFEFHVIYNEEKSIYLKFIKDFLRVF